MSSKAIRVTKDLASAAVLFALLLGGWYGARPFSIASA
jgi:diacylglycerol kinase